MGTDPKEPNFDTQIGLRGHSMRTPAQRQQNFAQESMMSELAAAAKIDPIQFRINNTTRPAADRGAERGQDRVGLGDAAVAEPDAASTTGSKPVIGQGCSAMLPPERVLGLRRAGVDRPEDREGHGARTSRPPSTRESSINPRQLKRNAEGGTVMGVSEALHEQVSFNKGKITDHDWVTFPILRIIGAAEDQGDRHEQPERRRLSAAGGEGPNGFLRPRSRTRSSTPPASSRGVCR